MQKQTANKVVSNTGILYLKMLITVGISLYSTRLILEALGETDYGLYNLIAGVVATLSFLNAAMSTSTQRYLSVSQGKGDVVNLTTIFNNSVLLHILIGVILILVFLLIGLYIFDGFLNIPFERVGAAKSIYNFMIITVFLSVVAVPFVASLNAHENMLWIAIVGIIEVILKLGLALSIPYFTGDKLIYYGISMSIIGLISLIIYASFCLSKYKECTIEILSKYDFKLIKELASFASWNLFGAACGVGRSQGLAIVLNLFFGTVINAAYGIANQVAGQLTFFSATMLRVLNPQIMKSEGAGNRNRMLKLAMLSSKYCFLLLAIFAIPIIFEMPSILNLWLKNVPDNTIIFCRLVLIAIMTNQLTIGLQSALQATGQIKVYQTVVGSIILLNLPIAYILLKNDCPPQSVLISYVVIELIACSLRLLFAKTYAGLSIKAYIKLVIYKILPATFSSVIVCSIILLFIDSSLYRLLLAISCSILTFIIVLFFWGMEEWERTYLHSILEKGKISLFNK